MKKTWLPVLCFMTCLVLSCSKDYFDRYPTDQPAVDNFFADEVSIRQVLNDGYYSLRGSYRYYFVFGDLAADGVYDSKFNNSSAHITINGNPFVEDAFANEDIGAGILRRGTGTFLMTEELSALYAPNDTRGQMNNRLQGSRRSYVFTKKYFDAGMTTKLDAGNDWIVLRYADIDLMYAEVQNELGNPTAAFPYLQAVRQRAGLTTDISLQADQLAMRSAIELERRLELACEGHRWFDLLRTNRLITVMNAHFKSNLSDDEIGKGNSVEQYELLFPVPRYQVNLNPAKITQNPGY